MRLWRNPIYEPSPFDNGTLVPGNPDVYHGARPEQLNRQVRDELSSDIIPSTQDDLPILPNFFLAVKGPDGSSAVAKRQACYVGALGARGMLRLHSYAQDNLVYDNNAYTFTSTYHDGQLKMFTSHPVQLTDGGGRSEYYMHQLNSWGMTGNVETFRQGATYYRNAGDLAKEQRDEAIRRANQKVSEQPVILTVEASFEEATSFESVAALKGASAIEALSQEVRTLVTEISETTIPRSEASPVEVSSIQKIARKCSNRNSKVHQSLRKRRIADDSDCSALEN